MFEALVSIIVVTFNSDKFILEALDSVVNQPYKNIELIISDDCSTDNTIPLINSWIADNQNKFRRIEFLTVIKNTGISTNHNRALNSCRGEWIKTLAGDDLLTTNCITDFINFTSGAPDARFIIGGFQNFDNQRFFKPIFVSEEFRNAPIDQQFKLMLRSITTFPGPVLFYHRETLLRIGGFDESYNYLEDTPIYYKILKSGYKFYAISFLCVHKRIHPESICAKDPKNNPYIENSRRFITKVILPECLNSNMYCIYWHRLIYLWILNPGSALFYRHRNGIKKYLLPIIDPYIWRYKNKNNWILMEGVEKANFNSQPQW